MLGVLITKVTQSSKHLKSVGVPFFMYTISVYFFAREQFSLKQAIISIFKIPAIWFALFPLISDLAQDFLDVIGFSVGVCG
jgi:hypothetical protein